jgi:hypothetical protein
MTARNLSKQDKDILHFAIAMITDCKLDEEEIENLIELIRNPDPVIKDHREILSK